MDKKTLAVLEAAFGATIACAMKEQKYPIIQPRPSKLINALVEAGYLEHIKIQEGALRVEGYQITQLGTFAYCQSLPPGEPED